MRKIGHYGIGDTELQLQSFDEINSVFDIIRQAFQQRVGSRVNALLNPTAGSGERILITLTQVNINNGHIYLRAHRSFFPEDSFGAANKNERQG